MVTLSPIALILLTPIHVKSIITINISTRCQFFPNSVMKPGYLCLQETKILLPVRSSPASTAPQAEKPTEFPVNLDTVSWFRFRGPTGFFFCLCGITSTQQCLLSPWGKDIETLNWRMWRIDAAAGLLCRHNVQDFLFWWRHFASLLSVRRREVLALVLSELACTLNKYKLRNVL